jgi:hypothetical protein
MELTEHTGLVDRCCVFGSDTRMISASWDKTCKIWDLESGECLHTCKEDNKVRGVAVYDNDKKAVCCGSGQWLSIWDIATGLIIKRVDMKHTSTVWGLSLVDYLVPLQNDGVWNSAYVAITYSGDGYTKFWDLTHEREREIVHARRAFDPTPMCVAVVPPSFELGQLPLLVGGFKSIQMNDVSSIGSGPSAGAIWAGSRCVEPGTWSDWIMDTIRENSAHFLYVRERAADLPTIIHKLADSQHGYAVLHNVIQEFAKERSVIVQGKPYNEEEHGKALGTIGMLSRAGISDRGSALAVAVEASHEDLAQLLLEDYREHIATFQFLAAGYAPATMVFELTEADIVHLFGAFPVLAAEFLQLLPMQATRFVAPESKCEFLDAKNERFVRAAKLHSPPARLVGRHFVEYWEPFIDEKWGKARGKTKDQHALRLHDTAWGVKVKAERVPLIAGGFAALDRITTRSQKLKTKLMSKDFEESGTTSPADLDEQEALLAERALNTKSGA